MTTPYDHLVTREQFIAEAARHEVTLEPHDFAGTEPHLTIYGMPAAQWLAAMTMD
jgi:hypothetical protein